VGRDDRASPLLVTEGDNFWAVILWIHVTLPLILSRFTGLPKN
jgi:hypothetical protein